ncbi:MAG TPA: winged helix-turn-helix domain-containing protein [Thermomicrobiales bacterium]|nr:winged helix-turn-helix domain-containing protein [Thermomicrobiales bacterium]
MAGQEATHRSESGGGYPDGDRLLAILSALANAHRLRIIAALADGPVHVSQLARDVQISRPLVYLHLKKLEEAGLVRGHLELADDGRSIKLFEIVAADLLITPELIAEAVKTLTVPASTQQ